MTKYMFRPASLEEALRDDPLREFYVPWTDFCQADVEQFVQVLDSATCEGQLQRYFEEHPKLLAQHLAGPPRWCIPHRRFGAELVPDFVLGAQSSIGFEWYGVELESPRAKLFNKNGDPSKVLNHAIRQIVDWRTWLKSNIDYARRPKSEQGMGLRDIDGHIKGIILIGRRADVEEDTRGRRREMCKELDIEIHTYDWLVEQTGQKYERYTRDWEW
ncbi:MAG: DUF4263 domain-containing protein [Armatimonadota bacterium]|nr:DUF4263 domain-containing protein [Armatimonadota bacterium]